MDILPIVLCLLGEVQLCDTGHTEVVKLPPVTAAEPLHKVKERVLLCAQGALTDFFNNCKNQQKLPESREKVCISQRTVP